MGYLSNVRLLYFISFFHALIPAYVIERLFWQARGMSVQMVIFCEVIYALTVTLCEIPSGILADMFGRKKLIIICYILSFGEFAILLFSNKFWHFALVMVLAGIGKSMSSGSENALLYDSLIAAGKQKNFEKILGQISAIDFTGTVIAALSGGVMANYFGLEFNYIVSTISCALVLALALFLKEPPSKNDDEQQTGFIEYTKQSLAVFKANPAVFIYCLSGAVLGSCIIYMEEFWQLVMENIGVPLIFFGIISAVLMGVRIPGNLFAYKLKEKFSNRKIFLGLIILSALSYCGIFFCQNILVILPMAAVSITAGIAELLVLGHLHHNTESSVRATVESFLSLGLRLVSVCIGLIFGYVSSLYSIYESFLLLGIICFFYCIFFAHSEKKYSKQLESNG